MHFGEAVGTACGAFAITNIDDIFVLVTFFAESATNRHMTPLIITVGQYIGFTAIVVVSMIGFGVSLVLPSEPIGFLGLLPIFLGFWGMFELLMPGPGDDDDDDDGDEPTTTAAGIKAALKVASITVINGGDNIGTYIPLFSQTRGAEIAVYVVVFYIGVGIWCFAGFLLMRQKQILHIAQKYAEKIIPLLYIGLGIFIIVKSDCFPWSIEHIDDQVSSQPGEEILAILTTAILLAGIGIMFWIKRRKNKKQQQELDAEAAAQDLELGEATTTTAPPPPDDVAASSPTEKQQEGSNSESTSEKVPANEISIDNIEKATTATRDVSAKEAATSKKEEVPVPIIDDKAIKEAQITDKDISEKGDATVDKKKDKEIAAAANEAETSATTIEIKSSKETVK